MYYISRQYLKAKSELTKLVSENYPQKISYWTNDIMTFNEKGQCQIQNEFPWKRVKCNFFRFAFWPTKDHDIIQGLRLRCTKDHFYFYPQIFPCLLDSPLYLEMGRWHMSRFSKSFFPPQFSSLQERCRSSEVFDYSNMLLSHWGLFHMWFVKEKIYLAHTLEWHTWFWQYTF